MNKKYLPALLICGVTALGSALWLTTRRNIIDITALMASMHTPADAPQAAPAPDNAAVATATDTKSDKPAAPESTDTPLNDKEAATTSPRNLGAITTQETETIDNPGNDGVIRRSRITLPEEALAWAQPEQYPKVGDLLQITIPENHHFIIDVLSFEQLPEQRGLVVLGGLHNGKGKADLMLYETHFSLVITDEENHRAYDIFYNVTQNYYTVEEIDTTLFPVRHTCPATEMHELHLNH